MTTLLAPYHLTDEQIRFFDREGYLILRDRIPQPLVQRLRAAADAWISAGSQLRDDDPRRVDYRFANRGGKSVMFRVDYLHAKGEAASLELLGCPQMLGVAESLAGPDFVPTYESLVFKSEGDGAAIAWHQDAVHPRRHRIFNVDVYLDAARRGEGALRVLPRSQEKPADICSIEGQFGWDVPEHIEVEMSPGDVLIHDVMVVHGSEPVQGNRLRRTIYYEFRAAQQILEEGPWDRTWVDGRLRLLPVALAHYSRYAHDSEQFEWNIADEFRPPSNDDEEAELRIVHGVHTPGSFCSAGSVKGRPVGVEV